MLKLGRAQGVAMAAGLAKGLPIFEYSPKKVKQAITGNGNATKEQVAAMLQQLLKFKETPEFLEEMQSKFGDFYLLPEGGTNELAIKGCEEILTQEDAVFDYICCCVGTGGTISGIINSSMNHQKVIGFPALKGDLLGEDNRKYAKNNRWELNLDYHFGGYAKIDKALIQFMNFFLENTKIQLDPVYTGKMLFGLYDLVEKGFFPNGSKILAIHTGGLQGIQGMNIKLEGLHLPKIKYDV